MNDSQRHWWEQAKSDHAMFVLLKRAGSHECHLLHYLQMTTEKLSKAYLWRSGHAPPKAHMGFVRFLRALASRPSTHIDMIARTFGDPRRDDFKAWVADVLPLAYSIQNLAPAEANDGPNPEYPWPHNSPLHHPAGHRFDIWQQLAKTGRGRNLITAIERAVRSFDSYA